MSSRTPSSGPSQYAPSAYQGWSDLRHTVNQRWPTTLKRIAATQHAALRTLNHPHRLGR